MKGRKQAGVVDLASRRASAKKNPESHWEWTRLASAYYAHGKYALAERYAHKALEMMPSCPLARWDYACALEGRGKGPEARTIWNALLKEGLAGLQRNSCSESRAWARSLLNDSHYRLGLSLIKARRAAQGRTHLKAYVAGRLRGARSIYRLGSARKLLQGATTPV